VHSTSHHKVRRGEREPNRPHRTDLNLIIANDAPNPTQPYAPIPSPSLPSRRHLLNHIHSPSPSSREPAAATSRDHDAGSVRDPALTCRSASRTTCLRRGRRCNRQPVSKVRASPTTGSPTSPSPSSSPSLLIYLLIRPSIACPDNPPCFVSDQVGGRPRGGRGQHPQFRSPLNLELEGDPPP
jgi:hypothetical protein